jgi:plastocyanin
MRGGTADLAAAGRIQPEDPMRRFTLLATLATAALFLGCGGATSSPTAAPATPTEAASPAEGGSDVSIVDFAFDPAELTVAIGDTVTWTNTGSATHTVKWQDGTPGSEQLESSLTYERTFEAAGSFPYVCGIHSQMTGTITVE